MLSTTPIEAPKTLLALATGCSPARTLIAGADTALALESARDAMEQGLIIPVLIGDPNKITASAQSIDWNIAAIEIEAATGDSEIAEVTGRLAADDAIEIIMKGHVHTDALMGAMLRKDANIRVSGQRMSHVFHMTVPGVERALMITDGALNIAPDLRTKQSILTNGVDLCHKLGIAQPNIAMLSASEEIMPQMPSTIDAAELVQWAKDEGLVANIAGPFAFDNAVSPMAAKIKGIDNPVAGNADMLLVPNIETGNGLFKMMTYFMGACPAGVVLGGRIPIIITSRADPAAARLASAALAVVARG